MATIAIGDVHGNFEALDDLLGTLKGEAVAGDVVVFLGDYIDRGPSTKDCIDRIIAFENEVDAEVVGLCGNHDDWLLRTRKDHRRHSWLIATDPYATIRSYSQDAAEGLREAVSKAGPALFGGDCALPYELFFDCVPAAHWQWFDRLRFFYQSNDCFCSHGGVDSRVPDLSKQTRFALIWGDGGFPESYTGQEMIVYGHRNNAVLDANGWPAPQVLGRTVGVDTISHGVLTAVRLPDGKVFQSARHRTQGNPRNVAGR